MNQSCDFHKYFFGDIVLFFSTDLYSFSWPLYSHPFPCSPDPCWFLFFFPLAITRRLKGAGIGRIPFPKCHKALGKSFRLKFRLVLWRKLLVDFIVITFPSPCQSQGGSCFSIFTMRTWWGCQRWSTKMCGASPKQNPGSFSFSY